MQGNDIDFKRLGTRKILVAEDVELNQYLIRQILESWGVEVTIAVNGYEALQLFQDNSFDCILMDVQMPEMDGIEATKAIRKFPDPVKATIPIIAFTANTLYGDREKYLNAGMNDYLAKPFDEVTLFNVISRNLLLDPSDRVNGALTIIEEKKIEMDGNGVPRLYDLSIVESVSGGDAGFIKKMVTLFIKTVPQNVEEMAAAMEAENWDQVRKMAHKLKSTVDSMGIKSIHHQIRMVETNAKQQKSLDEIPPMVRTIEAVINECLEQLKAEIS